MARQCPDTTTLLHNPAFWAMRSFELLIAIVTVAANVVIAIVSLDAMGLSRKLRRLFSIMSLNYAFLAGYIMSRSVHSLFAVYDNCLPLTTLMGCKLQESPLVFAYVHCGVISLAVVFERVTARIDQRLNQRIGCDTVCSLWQTATVVISLVATVFFFGADNGGRKLMPACSLLLAIETPLVKLCLVTALIALQALTIAALFIVGCCQQTSTSYPPQLIRLHISLCVRNTLAYEALLWGICLCLTGVALLYDMFSAEDCFICSFFSYECIFTGIPLTIAFCHPFLTVWYMDAIRYQLIKLCACIELFLPRQLLSQTTPITSSNLSFRTSCASEYLDITIEKPADGLTDSSGAWRVTEKTLK
uniref:G protein-coupled receptor n=1 Tax=Plectus sambesii TaxID=2011161 RepID=A0A914VYK0_9BILA